MSLTVALLHEITGKLLTTVCHVQALKFLAMAARSCSNIQGVNKHRGTPPPLTPAHVKCNPRHQSSASFPSSQNRVITVKCSPVSQEFSILHTSKDQVQQMIQKITAAGIRQHGVMKSCNYIWVVQRITFYKVACLVCI